jgi:hypothetical protein
MAKLKPKGARGRAMVRKLGRNYKTGNFEKIAMQAGRKYHSKKIGEKIAGKIFWEKVKKHLKG